MAVADIAVAMGPRNRRRFTAGAIGLAVIAAGAAGGLLTRSPDHSGSAVSARSTRLTPPPSSAHLGFGLTARQVLRLTGAPTTTHGSCWFFRPKAGMVGSIPIAPPGSSFPPASVGQFKVCFSSGVDAYASLQLFAQGQWRWVGWPFVTSNVPSR